jgi:hypothetical protein
MYRCAQKYPTLIGLLLPHRFPSSDIMTSCDCDLGLSGRMCAILKPRKFSRSLSLLSALTRGGLYKKIGCTFRCSRFLTLAMIARSELLVCLSGDEQRCAAAVY